MMDVLSVIQKATTVVKVRESVSGVVVESTEGANITVVDGNRLQVVTVKPKVEVKSPVVPVVERPGEDELVPPLALSYDAEGRLERVDFSGGALTLAYDGEGRLSTVTNSKTQTTRTLAYDDEGRLQSVIVN